MIFGKDLLLVFRSWAFLTSLLLCSAATFAHDNPILWVDKHGVGTLHIGDPEKDTLQLLSTHILSVTGDEACKAAKAKVVGYDLLFMNGKLARLDFHAARFADKHGLHVGSSEAELIEKYQGQYVVTMDQYDPQGKNYLALEQDGLGVMFYVSQRTVRSIAVGTKEALSLVEGCL